LKVAVASPFCWPEVRRGAERLLEDLAVHFSRCGHDVTVVSTTSQGYDGPVEWPRAEVRRVVFRRKPDAWQFGRVLTSLHRFGVSCYRFFRGERFDVIYCLNYHEAAAAILASRAWPMEKRPRVIYHSVGIPTAAYFRAVPHDRLAVELCFRRGKVLVLSQFARDRAWEGFRFEPDVLPPPVHVEQFAANGTLRSREPVFAFVGDVNVPRKGALTMARAFAIVLSELPEAQLLYCGHVDPGRQAEIGSAVPPEVAKRIRFTGVARLDEMPAMYASASVIALPAIWEAFGLVLVEALAAGTPVVGCRHGGIPDIITDQRIGRMFDPGEVVGKSEPNNDVDFAQALLQAHELSREAETRQLCVAHARAFSWDVLGSRYEAVLAAREP
jgi:phosphatidyl-myo-inositol alpha-mannosyltransferase